MVKKKVANHSEEEPVVDQQLWQTKKKKRRKLLAMLILILLLLLVLILLIRNKSSVSSVPVENETFYSAVYQNKQVLFYRYAGMLQDLKPIGQYEGQYVTYTDALSSKAMNRMANVQYVDFRKLQNPKKLFTFDRYATLIDVRFSQDKSYLVMSFIGGMQDNINYMYQVHLTTAQAKEIWEHPLRTGNPPFNEGDAYITQFVPDRYVVFDMIQGDPPPDTMPLGTVVLNMQTSAVKTLDPAGDVQINPANNTISFKTIGKTLVPCVGKHDPVCFAGDTQKNAYEPVGPVQTEPLP